MGRLVIAHHKSYHPYRRDNIEKVRKDEEEARKKEEQEEGRMMLADSEARIDHLRARVGNKEKKDREPSAGGSALPADLPTSAGHINFFQDLEHNAIARMSKKAETNEAEKGFALAPSAKDLKPWYSERSIDRMAEVEDERRKRDTARKSRSDPLTSITHQLASQSASTHDHRNRRPPPVRPQSTSALSTQPPEVQSRLVRETSERQRALDLIRRKKRETEGSETPNSVHGFGSGGGYGDVFNRKEVEDAHRGRERRRDYPWSRSRNTAWEHGEEDNNGRRGGGSARVRRW